MRLIPILLLFLGVTFAEDCENFKQTEFWDIDMFCQNAVITLEKSDCEADCLKCGTIYEWEEFNEKMLPMPDFGAIETDAEFYTLIENIEMMDMEKYKVEEGNDITPQKNQKTDISIIFNIPNDTIEGGRWNLNGRLNLKGEWIDLYGSETRYTVFLFAQVMKVNNSRVEMKKFEMAWKTQKRLFNTLNTYLGEREMCEKEVGRNTVVFRSKPTTLFSTHTTRSNYDAFPEEEEHEQDDNAPTVKVTSGNGPNVDEPSEDESNEDAPSGDAPVVDDALKNEDNKDLDVKSDCEMMKSSVEVMLAVIFSAFVAMRSL